MTATVTTHTSDDRKLLADVSAWAHVTGWTAAGWRGFQNGRYEDEATIAVRPNEAGFQVWRKPADAPHFTGQPTEYPADSIRQAIDMLHALGILPPEFSSAYRAGVQAHAELVKAFLPDVHITEIPASAR